MRISRNNLKRLFGAVFQKYGNRQTIAAAQNVSVRTVRDWEKGRWSLPLSVFEKLVFVSGFKKNIFSPKLLPDFWHIKNAGRKGALARMRKYGNFGTQEGRRLGGIRSFATHRKLKDKFITIAKQINIPADNEKLAEFLGILVGDGHLSDYQVSIYMNSISDKEYADFVQKLIGRLFDVFVSKRIVKKEHTIRIVASSKNLVAFLNKRGMPVGNKLKSDLKIPDWIRERPIYEKAFIRGLFDTDGCVYLDAHKINGRKYFYMGWTITSYADSLRADIIAILKQNGFSPTQRFSQKSVYLRRQEEIRRYFEEIGTSNLKHLNRYIGFCSDIKGRGAPNGKALVSKTRTPKGVCEFESRSLRL